MSWQFDDLFGLEREKSSPSVDWLTELFPNISNSTADSEISIESKLATKFSELGTIVKNIDDVLFVFCKEKSEWVTGNFGNGGIEQKYITYSYYTLVNRGGQYIDEGGYKPDVVSYPSEGVYTLETISEIDNHRQKGTIVCDNKGNVQCPARYSSRGDRSYDDENNRVHYFYNGYLYTSLCYHENQRFFWFHESGTTQDSYFTYYVFDGDFAFKKIQLKHSNTSLGKEASAGKYFVARTYERIGSSPSHRRRNTENSFLEHDEFYVFDKGSRQLVFQAEVSHERDNLRKLNPRKVWSQYEKEGDKVHYSGGAVYFGHGKGSKEVLISEAKVKYSASIGAEISSSLFGVDLANAKIAAQVSKEFTHLLRFEKSSVEISLNLFEGPKLKANQSIQWYIKKRFDVFDVVGYYRGKTINCLDYYYPLREYSVGYRVYEGDDPHPVFEMFP